MKKTALRICAFGVALVLLLGCLAGCNVTISKNRKDKDASQSLDPEGTGDIPENDEAERAYELVTVAAHNLYVHSGPGVKYETLYKLQYGDLVKIYSQTTVEDAIWGESDDGWVFLQYTPAQETTQEEIDQALESKLLGDWYLYESDRSTSSYFRVFTFLNDGTFYQSRLMFDNDTLDGVESNSAFCAGRYWVENGQLILDISTYFDEYATVPLGGVDWSVGTTAKLDLIVGSNQIKLTSRTVTSLNRGGDEEVMALMKELFPPEPEPEIGTTDPRILGEWSSFREIDYEAQSVTFDRDYCFNADGTFTASQGGSRYLYNPETGELYYDETQLGIGGYFLNGTYSFDGSTLLLNITYCEFDAEYLGTSTYFVTFSGDTMLLQDSYRSTTYYPVSWDEIGPYFFG